MIQTQKEKKMKKGSIAIGDHLTLEEQEPVSNPDSSRK
jgi:hypothetical protein